MNARKIKFAQFDTKLEGICYFGIYPYAIMAYTYMLWWHTYNSNTKYNINPLYKNNAICKNFKGLK